MFCLPHRRISWSQLLLERTSLSSLQLDPRHSDAPTWPSHQVGVVAEPSVTEVLLQPDDRFLVLASAGVWKVFSPQEIVDLVAEQPDANSAVNAVVAEANTRWEELWQGENTTVVVFVFPNDPEW